MRLKPGWVDLLKVVGLAFLAAYLLTHTQRLEWLRVGVYAAVYVVVTVGFIAVIEPVAKRVFKSRRLELPSVLTEKQRAVVLDIARRPWQLLLVPGEDGLFFVPLALIGVRWWTALPIAALFGLAHVPRYSWLPSAAKAVSVFVNSLLVLPHGIIHFAVAHALMDVVSFGLVWLALRFGWTGAEPVTRSGNASAV